MRASQFEGITLWSIFTLFFQCEALLARSVAKLTVFGVSRIMMGACCRAPAIPVYLDRVRIADAGFSPSNCVTRSLARPTHLSLPSSSTSSSYSSTSLAFFHPSTSSTMPPAENGNKHTGAGSSAPSGQGSSSRPAHPLSFRNFNRIFVGSQSRSAAPPPAQDSKDPLGTLGAPTARAPLLEGAPQSLQPQPLNVAGSQRRRVGYLARFPGHQWTERRAERACAHLSGRVSDPAPDAQRSRVPEKPEHCRLYHRGFLLPFS